MRKKKVKRELQGTNRKKREGNEREWNDQAIRKRGKKKKGAGAVKWKKRGEEEEKVRKRKQGGMQMGREVKSD